MMRIAVLAALVNIAYAILPAAAQVDETSLAKGNTPPFYTCATHSDCEAGSVCANYAGDSKFYCKPICSNTAECRGGWPQYPNLGCYPARRANGSNFPYRVCNQALSQLAPTGITSPPAPPVSSTMGVNFSTSLSQLCKQLDDLVPQTISENPGRQCLQWGVYKGPPITCTGNGNTLHVQAEIHARAGQRCGLPGGIGQVSCGFDSDPIKRARIGLSSTIAWNSNYSVNASPTVTFDLVDSCDLTFLNIDARGFIQEKAQGLINQLNAKLPTIIANSTSFQPLAAQLWSALQKPIQVLGTPPVWLLAHPRSFVAGLPKVVGDNLYLTMGLEADPQIIETQAAPAPDTQPLSPLKVGP